MLSNVIIHKSFTPASFDASKSKLCEDYINLLRVEKKSDVDIRILKLLEDEIILHGD